MLDLFLAEHQVIFNGWMEATQEKKNKAAKEQAEALDLGNSTVDPTPSTSRGFA